MTENGKQMKQAFSEAGILLDERMLDRFELFFHELVETNKVMNLTAITEFPEVLTKHFLDSCILWQDFQKNGLPLPSSVIDIGTGAGFPGIPLKIVQPEIPFTLLDTLDKRIRFLSGVTEKMELTSVTPLHSRAEDAARRPEYREAFELAVSRAVSALPVLSEYCLPFVKIGGLFVAYKSGNFEDEVESAKNAVQVLGGRIENISRFSVPGTDYERSLVYVRKISATPDKYPRKAGKPEKKPL